MDDSASSFAEMDHVCRWFAYFLVFQEIPFRGAIACDEFYADTNHNIFLGKALVEAHEYGEIQDWIGFFLCPSAVEQLGNMGLPADERLHYRQVDYPMKKSSCGLQPTLPACVIGNYAKMNGINPAIKALESMKSKLNNPQETCRVRKKYENTIQFLKTSISNPS